MASSQQVDTGGDRGPAGDKSRTPHAVRRFPTFSRHARGHTEDSGTPRATMRANRYAVQDSFVREPVLELHDRRQRPGKEGVR